MKVLGVTRPIDRLYRIVIPRELCRTYDLKPNDRMAFFTDADNIVIKKHHIHCVFCPDTENLTEFGGQYICGNCKDDIRKFVRT